MVIYNARTHTVTTVDGRETCPAACTSTLFVDPTTGKPMGYTAASDQPLSTGVPSMVATWATAVGDYGGLSLGADLQPAIRIAKRGFAVNFDFNQPEQSSLSTPQAYPASRSLLLTPSGEPDELVVEHLIGRAGLLQQRARPTAHQSARRALLPRHRANPPARQLPG